MAALTSFLKDMHGTIQTKYLCKQRNTTTDYKQKTRNTINREKSKTNTYAIFIFSGQHAKFVRNCK